MTLNKYQLGDTISLQGKIVAVGLDPNSNIYYTILLDDDQTIEVLEDSISTVF
jgi:hypothetical protein